MTPSPKDVAAKLRAAAAELEARGDRAVRMRDALLSRGYPSSTLGDGGSRGSDPTSSTERAVLANNSCDDDGADRWHTVTFVNGDLLAQLRTLEALCAKTIAGIHDLMSHASDEDPLPAGSGSCQACDRMCRPDQKRGDRLRSGYCPACFEAWRRAGYPERFGWEQERRVYLAPKQAS